MDSDERWADIERVLDEVLELEGAEQAAAVERECSGDPELRHEVERYLRAAASASPLDGSLEERAGELIAAASARFAPAGLLAGDRIGAYVVDGILGEGGMGTVYLAHRADGQFERQVALKVLSRGLADEASNQRFHRERRILAGLRHHHIAQLLDGGMTPYGAPYLVLEYIEGVPITDFCQHHQLGRDERVRLFLQACDGVHHAHRNGVVHRDLKPSNILVENRADGEAAVSVLDFGIASHPEHLDVTLTGQVIGTPGYMAPEQARGEREAVDRRSDLFSLGVILYELLCDRRPFDSGDARFAMFTVLEQEPIPPRRVVANLPVDLATISLTCLEPEPEQRYGSVRALADDLERYLDGRPIAAQPVGLLGRLRRRARRHKVAASLVVLGAAAILASAVALAVGAVKYTRDLERERSLAVAAREDVEELLEFMLEDLHAELQPIGRLDLLDQVARKSLAYYDAQPPEELPPESLRRQGLAVFNIGMVLEAQGHWEEALRAYQRHREVAAHLVAMDADPRWQLEHARALLAIAEVYSWRGDVQQALEHLRQALILTGDLQAQSPTGLQWQDQHFLALSNAGWMLREAGEVAEATEMLQEAISFARTQRSLYDQDHPGSMHWQHKEAVAESYLGLVFQYRGSPDEALARFRRAREICSVLVDAQPTNTSWLAELQLVHVRLGTMLKETGRGELALRALEDGLAIARRLVDLEPDNAKWRRELNVNHSTIALVRHELGDLDGALASLDLALAISRTLAQRAPHELSAQYDYAWDLLERGRILRQLGSTTQAEEAFTGVVEVLQLVTDESTEPYSQHTLAYALLELGRVDEARLLIGRLDSPFLSSEIKALCRQHGIEVPDMDAGSG